MAFLFRCPECRTRRRSHGLFTQHLRESGHKACICGGYHYKHRPGSPYCVHNPMSAALLASRYGASDEEVADIALDLALSPSPAAAKPRKAMACPF